MTEEELKIIISAQTDQLKTGLNSAMTQVNAFNKNVSKSTKAMSSSFNALGGVLAKIFTTGAVIKFGKDAINMASDLVEVQNVVDVAFGEMSYKAEEFSKIAIKQFGMSELTAKRTSSTFMAMAKSMGLGMESASNMAIEVAKLSGDVASFYNMSVDDASTKLKSIFTGETETLKSIGVVMTEVNLKQFALTQGITKNYNEMTQAEKVSLRYKYVMNALNDAQGDFARTSDSWANQTKILAEQWKSFLGIIGNGLITILNPLIRALNSALSVMISFAQSLGSLFGIKTQTAITSTGGAVADVGDAYEEMGEQAESSGKKAKKGLMAFDEITNLQQDSSSGVGGAGGGTSELATIEATESPLNDATKKLEDFSKVDLKPLKKSFDNIRSSVELLIDDFKPLKNAIADAFSNMIDENAQKSIDLLASSLNFVANDIKVLNPIIKICSDVLGEVFKIAGKIQSSVLGKVIETWTKNFELLSDTLSFLKPLTDKVGQSYEWLKQKFNELNPNLNIANKFIDIMADGITHLLLPFPSFIADVKDLKDGIVDLYGKAKPLFEDLIDFISNVFAGRWKEAFTTLKESTSNIWDGIKSIVKKAINSIIDSVNKMIGGLETALNFIVDRINSIEITNPFTGEEIWSPHLTRMQFSRIPKLARGGIVDGATTFIAGEHGKEAVIPLENNTEWMDKMAQKVVGMMTAVNSLNNDSITINVTSELNGKEIANATIKDLNLESIRRGYKPILNV